MAESKMGYCVKCKKKVQMENPEKGVTKNNREITKGSCPECGTTVCAIGGMAPCVGDTVAK